MNAIPKMSQHGQKYQWNSKIDGIFGIFGLIIVTNFGLQLSTVLFIEWSTHIMDTVDVFIPPTRRSRDIEHDHTFEHYRFWWSSRTYILLFWNRLRHELIFEMLNFSFFQYLLVFRFHRLDALLTAMGKKNDSMFRKLTFLGCSSLSRSLLPFLRYCLLHQEWLQKAQKGICETVKTHDQL